MKIFFFKLGRRWPLLNPLVAAYCIRTSMSRARLVRMARVTCIEAWLHLDEGQRRGAQAELPGSGFRVGPDQNRPPTVKRRRQCPRG